MTSVSPRAPIAGLTSDGWQIAYDETPNESVKVNETRRKIQDLTWSLGIVLKDDGAIRDALLGLPAANAGIGPGMKLVAVNGRRYTKEVLAAAIREAKTSSAPIELLTETNDFFRTHPVDYHGGMRYPHLAKIEGKEDQLAAVLRARAR